LVIVIIIVTTMFMVLLSWHCHSESSSDKYSTSAKDAPKLAIAIYYYSARKLILILPSHTG